jgi:hypothetical protein
LRYKGDAAAENRAAECLSSLSQSMLDALAIVATLPPAEQDELAALMVAAVDRR